MGEQQERSREAAQARARQRERLAAVVKPPPGKCWRHDYLHREYVCTCDPPVAGDTGREDTP